MIVAKIVRVKKSTLGSIAAAANDRGGTKLCSMWFRFS